MRTLSIRVLALRRLDDESLLERVLEGQEAAFAELYRRFHSLVYGYCLARLLDPHAAEDAAQDAFVRIARASGLDSPVRSARAWVLAVARSAVIDQTRRSKRMPTSLPAEELPDVAVGASAADEALEREDARTVFLALARMRPRYRGALVLREMHGLSSIDIGETMGLKPGAVDTLLCRARDAFGREYAEVAGLAGPCRDAIELVYRERGTGIDEHERARLQEHLAVCPRCAREQNLAASPSRLAFLLPMMGLRPEGFGLLTRALSVLGSAPASFEAMGLAAVKVSAVVVAAAVATAPIASTFTKAHSVAPAPASARTAPAGPRTAVVSEATATPEATASVSATSAIASEAETPSQPPAGEFATEPSGAPASGEPSGSSDGAEDSAVVPVPDEIESATDTGAAEPEASVDPTPTQDPGNTGGAEFSPEDDGQPPIDYFETESAAPAK